MSLIKRVKVFNEDVMSKLSKLSKRERRYFDIMKSQSGVLFITAKPGIGKSAIMRAIANKLGFNYVDVRLSMVDETDVGLFPDVNTHGTGADMIKVLDHVVPKWAVLSNDKPTIIHFEELNRAPLAVRNAALQLLLEREIGTEFSFNDNVLMVASGNLGDEDGTDVEEFDTALKNRLIHVHHDIPAIEWIKEFANDNIHPDIVSYIKAKPTLLYPDSKGNDSADVKAFASHRSWTFLSDYILNTYGRMDGDTFVVPNSGEYRASVEREGHSFIGGKESTAFVRWLDELQEVNIEKIIKDWSSVKDTVDGYRKAGRRDRYTELIGDLANRDLEKMDKSGIKNVEKFLNTCNAEERTSYLLELLDDNDVTGDGVNFLYLMKSFGEEVRDATMRTTK